MNPYLGELTHEKLDEIINCNEVQEYINSMKSRVDKKLAQKILKCLYWQLEQHAKEAE